MAGIQRYDARLVRDACGNADVLMKEAHDGLFVRNEDQEARERELREALEGVLPRLRCENPIRKPLPNPEGYAGKWEVSGCGKCPCCKARRAALRQP